MREANSFVADETLLPTQVGKAHDWNARPGTAIYSLYLGELVAFILSIVVAENLGMRIHDQLASVLMTSPS